MLSILYLIMVGLSSERPNPIQFTPSGSPMGNNISGRNIPKLIQSKFSIYITYIHYHVFGNEHRTRPKYELQHFHDKFIVRLTLGTSFLSRLVLLCREIDGQIYFYST